MNVPTKLGLQQEMAAAHRVADALAAAGITPDDPDYSELMTSETNIQFQLARLLRVARREEAECVGLKKLGTDLVARLDRKQLKADRLRSIVKDAMQSLGIRTLPAPDFSASLSDGTAKVIITDETKIPEQFWVHSRAVDKRALAAALAAGSVEGATMSNPEPKLSIRSK